MNSEDDRVAAVACNAILDRALGKPKVIEEVRDDIVARIKAMTPEERIKRARQLLEGGRTCRRTKSGSASKAGKAIVIAIELIPSNSPLTSHILGKLRRRHYFRIADSMTSISRSPKSTN